MCCSNAVEFDKTFEIVGETEKMGRYLKSINLGTDVDNTEIATSAGGLELLNLRKWSNFKVNDLKFDFAVVELITNLLV